MSTVDSEAISEPLDVSSARSLREWNDTFQAAMLAMVERHGSIMGIIAAHNSATDPDDKRRLEVAGLYVSYVQLKDKVPDAERRLLRQKAFERWVEIMQQ